MIWLWSRLQVRSVYLPFWVYDNDLTHMILIHNYGFWSSGWYVPERYSKENSIWLLSWFWNNSSLRLFYWVCNDDYVFDFHKLCHMILTRTYNFWSTTWYVFEWFSEGTWLDCYLALKWDFVWLCCWVCDDDLCIWLLTTLFVRAIMIFFTASRARACIRARFYSMIHRAPH